MIRGCVFNLSGTIVDHYSLTLKLSLKKTFSDIGILLSNDILQKNLKYHPVKKIENIVNDDKINFLWEQRFSKAIDEDDKYKLFKDLEKNNYLYKSNFLRPIPHVHLALNNLKKGNLKLGLTSEFNENLTKNILNSLNFNQYNFHCEYENNDLKNIMKKMNIEDKSELLVFSDNIHEIQKIKKLDYKVVGVYRWSSEMDVKDIETANLLDRLVCVNDNIFSDYHLLKTKLLNVREKMSKSGCDYYIQSLKDINHLKIF
jgi:phosphoglycolate phosphatase-like HAD superfamily hydrolase